MMEEVLMFAPEAIEFLDIRKEAITQDHIERVVNFIMEHEVIWDKTSFEEKKIETEKLSKSFSESIKLTGVLIRVESKSYSILFFATITICESEKIPNYFPFIHCGYIIEDGGEVIPFGCGQKIIL